MDRKKHIAWLNSMEQRYPVNEWQINNIHIWPLIKIKLSLENSNNNRGTKPALSKRKQITKVVQGFLTTLKLILKKKSKRSFNFYCLASHFRYDLNQILINRYFNQLIEEDKKNEKGFKILDYSNKDSLYKRKIDHNSKTIFLDKMKYFALVIRTFRIRYYKNCTEEWREFGTFLNEINVNTPENTLTRKSIINQYLLIDSLSKIYKVALEKYNVDNIYILCYYVSEMYAMNIAASALNINNWDIQHGGQGSLHAAYANFKKIPASGYKLLPQYFWCWDHNSALEIEKWSQKQTYHEVRIKGNSWIEYVTANLTNKIVTNQKLILYTLQPIEDRVIESYIIETISKTPDDYVWWLRLHPRQLEQKSELVRLLKLHNIYDKVEIDKAASYPLPVILNKCWVHISNYSGAILEAYLQKKITIIINPIGVETFPEVVDSEYSRIVLNENSQDLLRSIKSIKA